MTMNNLKASILSEMGITRWKRRSALAAYYPHWILFGVDPGESTLPLIQLELIHRMAKALQWPAESYTLIACVDDMIPDYWQAQWQSQKPKSMLIFGSTLGKDCEQEVKKAGADVKMAVIGSLDQIMNDPQAKRTAWEKMQSLL